MRIEQSMGFYPTLILAKHQNQYYEFLQRNKLQTTKYRYARGSCDQIRGWVQGAKVFALDSWALNPLYTAEFVDCITAKEFNIQYVKMNF